MKGLTKHRSYKLADDILKIYANSNLPEELENEVKVWLVSESHRKEKLEAMRSLWENLDVRESTATEKEAWLAVRQKAGITSVSRFSLRRKAIRAAAVLFPVLLAGGSFYYFHSGRNVPFKEPFVAETVRVHQVTNESGYIRLDDGTEIWINQGSELSYINNRQVKLRGEAYFMVAGGSGEKFTVETDEALITALGTCFNVQAYPGDPESVITLYQGKLQLETTHATQLMHTGEECVINHEQGNLQKRLTAKSRPDWNRQFFVYENIRLKEIFNDLEKNIPLLSRVAAMKY